MFKDIAHLYINSYVQFSCLTDKKIIKLIDVPDFHNGVITDIYDANYIKPLLRPLSDITIPEVYNLIKFCSKENLSLGYYGYGYKDDQNEFHESVLCFRFDRYCRKSNKNLPVFLLQIDSIDDDFPIILGRFTNDGIQDDLIEYPFKLTLFLINQGFDLFNLIKTGQALNIKNQQL